MPKPPHQLPRFAFIRFHFATQPLTDCTLDPQESKAIHDGHAYISSVTAAPDWSSYSSIFAAYDSEDFFGTSTKAFTDITANPSFTALPNGVQSYYVSVQNTFVSILSNDLSGDTSQPTSVATSVATGKATSTANVTGGAAPKPTGAVMAAGAVAAGLLAVIAML